MVIYLLVAAGFYLSALLYGIHTLIKVDVSTQRFLRASSHD